MDLEYATLEEIRKTNDHLERLGSIMTEMLACLKVISDEVIEKQERELK